MSDNNARLLTFSPNSYLNLGSRAVAVKTGTTNDLRDNLTVGWSKDTIVGVWVGNNNNDKMKNVASGVSGAAPIWRREMLDVLGKRPDKPFSVPVGMSQVEVDKISGYPSHDGFPSYKEWFIDGSVRNGPDPIHTKLKLCKLDPGKLADPISISQGSYDEKEYIVIKETDPLTNKSLWQKGIDDWIIKQTEQLYKFPIQVCDATLAMDVQIVSPENMSRVDGDSVTIRVNIVSSKPIVEVKFFVDWTLEQTFIEAPYMKVVKFPSGTIGQHTVRVTARNNEGQEGSNTHEFGVNTNWVKLTPTPSPTQTTTPTISPT